MNDVAGVGVDCDRPTRALPLHALHGIDQRRPIGRAVGLFECLVDEVQAIPAAHRDEVGTVAIRLLEGGDIILVRLRIVGGRIDAGGHHTQHGVAHSGEVVVVDEIAGADQLDAGLVEAALGELLGEGAGLPRRHEHEQRVGAEVAGTLQEWREIGILQRHLDGLEHLPAGLGEGIREHGGRLGAGRPVRLDDGDLLAAVLGRPFGDDAGLLAEREARAHHVRIVRVDHARGARHHHHVGGLRLGRERAHRHGARGQRRADHRDLLIDDQFLRQPLGVIRNAGIVAHDQLDLAARDGGAVLLHVEPGGGLDLLADRTRAAGQRQHQADFGHLLGAGARARKSAHRQCHGSCHS